MAITLSDPLIQSAIQQGLLVREFLDPLLARMMFRAEAGEPEKWPLNSGETQIFTENGNILPDAEPLEVGKDPEVVGYGREQWSVTIRTWPKRGARDVPMPQSIVQVLSLFREDAKRLGLQAGQTMNLLTRNPIFNAGLAGWTVADGAQVATTALRVKRLNGFTTARRPDIASGSPVAYNPVSPSNPQRIFVNGVANQVIGFTPDNPGDELGPGVINLSGAVTVADRDIVQARDASFIWRVGTGNSGKIDNVSSANPLRLSDIRTVVAHAGKQNVPRHRHGFYNFHTDEVAMSQLHGDPEFQRLATSAAVMGDDYLWKNAAIAVAQGVVFLSNNMTPFSDTIRDADPNQEENIGTYSLRDPFGGEIWNKGTKAAANSEAVRHSVLIGQGGLKEYYMPNEAFLSDAGVVGYMADFTNLANDGVEMRTNGVSLIVRAPANRHQDLVSMAWKWVGGHIFRPDGISGGLARYKRAIVIQSGQ